MDYMVLYPQKAELFFAKPWILDKPLNRRNKHTSNALEFMQ
jgi:hypothetical protein